MTALQPPLVDFFDSSRHGQIRVKCGLKTGFRDIFITDPRVSAAIADNKTMRGVFWTVRSRWDYFAFIAVAQWVMVGIAVMSFFVAFVWEPFIGVTYVSIGLVYGVNLLAWLAVLSTAFGSKRHPHLDPGGLYHLTALLFGPIVGVHYLYRTGRPTDGDESHPSADE